MAPGFLAPNNPQSLLLLRLLSLPSFILLLIKQKANYWGNISNTRRFMEL